MWDCDFSQQNFLNSLRGIQKPPLPFGFTQDRRLRATASLSGAGEAGKVEGRSPSAQGAQLWSPI